MKVDREAVKTLAIAVGVREAARQLGLNENTVIQWSKRYQWFPKPQPLSPRANESRAVISVIKPSAALATALADDNRETKLGLSKYARKQAKVLSERGKLKDHRAFKDIVGGASQLHGWEEKQGESGLHLHMLNLGPTQVKIGNETHQDDREGQSGARVVSE